MKKLLIAVVTGTLVVGAGFAAYAEYGMGSRGRGMGRGGMYAQDQMQGRGRGGNMYVQDQVQGRGRGGRMYAQGHMQGRGRGNRMYAQGQMQGRGRGGGMYAQGQMQGRGGRWNTAENFTCPYGMNYGRWNAPSQQQQGTAPEMLSEEKIQESAQEYLTKYLSDYSIDKVEKDGWRPLYFITVKGENEAVQKMIVHGFSGQVMHVYPESTVEETPAE